MTFFNYRAPLKEIPFFWPNKITPASGPFVHFHALDKNGGNSFEFAHHKSAGCGKFVRQSNQRRLEQSSLPVALPAIIQQGLYSRHSQRDIDEAFAPWTTERVGYDHAQVDAKSLRKLPLKRTGRAIRILGQQQSSSHGSI